MVEAFYWKNNTLYILDQKLLPQAVRYIPCRTYQQVAQCIKDMNVRGAPAIGIVAAYGLALAMINQTSRRNSEAVFRTAEHALRATRPTAVNLCWAADTMKKVFRTAVKKSDSLAHTLFSAACALHTADRENNKKIGAYGARLLKTRSTVLTHCNAGSLATGGWGTALGVIRSGFDCGKIRHVFVDETRPYLQGARLTAWELKQDKIPFVLITDSMAGYMMKTEKIDAVIVGADRIAASGDTANKIGTYSLAVLAQYHRIPFYVAAPVSTFDLSLRSGNDIPIEERSADEVTRIGPVRIAPDRIRVRHPAFDVTPAKLITAIITERGVIARPNRQRISRIISSGI